MTRLSQDGARLFSTPESAAGWLKATLQSWERTRKAASYAPFEIRFRPNLNPHEILYAVYRGLGGEGDPASMFQANFREGAAMLIGEPELLEWHPACALELIRLGGRLSSIEILEAATQLMRVANFAGAPDAVEDRSVLLATEVYHNIVTAPFSGSRFLAFLEACKRHTQEEEVDPTHLLLTLARNDRENWAAHAMSLTFPLNAFYLRRAGTAGFAEILDYFMEDLLAALDRSSLDFYRIFVTGWATIAGSRFGDRLIFLYNWPPLGGLFSDAGAHPSYRVRRNQEMRGDAKRTENPYFNYLSAPACQASHG